MNEAEADIFGLNASREPDGFAETALLLGEYRKLQWAARPGSATFPGRGQVIRPEGQKTHSEAREARPDGRTVAVPAWKARRSGPEARRSGREAPGSGRKALKLGRTAARPERTVRKPGRIFKRSGRAVRASGQTPPERLATPAILPVAIGPGS